MIGKGHSGALVTLVDRVSNMVLIEWVQPLKSIFLHFFCTFLKFIPKTSPRYPH